MNREAKLGQVIRADIQDKNGNRKSRPAIVVSPSSDIAGGKPIHVVAVTTQIPDTLSEVHVVLPWDRQGKARSGLRRKCVAVVNWQAEIQAEDIQQIVGTLPSSVLGEILDKIVALQPRPQQASDDPAPG